MAVLKPKKSKEMKLALIQVLSNPKCKINNFELQRLNVTSDIDPKDGSIIRTPTGTCILTIYFINKELIPPKFPEPRKYDDKGTKK